MIRRILVLSSLTAATLSLMACSGGGQSPAASPLAPAPEGQFNTPTDSPQVPSALTSQAGLGGVALNGDLSQSALAIYTVDIDADSLQATASLKATRTGAANDDLFLLSIDSFLNAGSFKITGVAATPETIDLTWQLTHPFPAPNNITGTPNGSTNRADLGIAGQVVYLADVASATGNTYFTDVVLNTELVANADAYLDPAGLLTLTGNTANAIPYQSLVDETAGGIGSRNGISNSGDVTGNFGADGWTRGEFGASNNGWTGFGVLHQGQVSQRVLSLDKDALTGGFSLDVAVLAKYNDPRGGDTPAQKKANRLPPATADASLFAYRMPHGALDVERISFLGESGGFIPNTISASELSFHVVDWDARATETTAADLSEDAAFDTVASGESGLPTLEVCIPGVLGDATVLDAWDDTTVLDDDSGVGGDLTADTGRPGDALYYSKLITKGIGSGQTDGTYTGLVRATDVEDAIDPSLTISLNGELAPLTSNLPRPITFQNFTVQSITPNDPPTATVTGPLTNVASGNGVLTLTVNPYNDPDGDPISIRFDWNDDGDFDDAGETDQTLDGTPPDTFNSPVFYNNTTLTPEVRDVPYEFTDNVNPAISGTANFTLGANQAPQVVSGTVTLAVSSLVQPAIFSLQNNTLNVTDPEGDAITYTVRAVPTSGTTQTASSIAGGSLSGYNAAPVMGVWNAVNSTIAFTVFANDALHATTSGTTVPSSPLTGTVTVGGCALTMASTNLALASLTTGSVLRSGTTVQPVTGIRLTWTDIAAEAQYAIQRGTWPDGATIASVAFSTIGTAAANATSYDDTTVNASGTRYLYRVMPRCSVGGPDIATPSQLAMVALQNFETAPVGNVLPGGSAIGNGWTVNSSHTNTSPTAPYQITDIVTSGFISGARSLEVSDMMESSPSNLTGWVAFSAPQLNDRANFGSISVSQYECTHQMGGTTSGTSGYAFMTNSARPTNSATLPATPNNWTWSGAATTGTAYNDNSASSMTTGSFPNITTVNGGSVVASSTLFNFGVGSTAASFSAYNLAFGTFTQAHDFAFFVAASADNSQIERARIDDIAWIVY